MPALLCRDPCGCCSSLAGRWCAPMIPEPQITCHTPLSRVYTQNTLRTPKRRWHFLCYAEATATFFEARLLLVKQDDEQRGAGRTLPVLISKLVRTLGPGDPQPSPSIGPAGSEGRSRTRTPILKQMPRSRQRPTRPIQPIFRASDPPRIRSRFIKATPNARARKSPQHTNMRLRLAHLSSVAMVSSISLTPRVMEDRRACTSVFHFWASKSVPFMSVPRARYLSGFAVWSASSTARTTSSRSGAG